MAKQFGGFTPEQLGKIEPAMAGMQADEQVKYMAANPGVSSRVGNMAQQAKRRIAMANGGVVRAANGVDVAGLTLPPEGMPPSPPLQPGEKNPLTGEVVGGPALPPDDIKDPVDSLPIISPGEPTPDPTRPPELPTMPQAPEMGERPDDTLTFDPSDIQARGAIKNLIGSTSQASYIVLPDGKRIESDTGNEEEEVANVKRMAEEYIAQKKLDATDWDVKNKDYIEKKSIYDKDLELYKSFYGQKAEESSSDPNKTVQETTKTLGTAQNLLKTYTEQLAGMGVDDPQRDAIQTLIDEQQLKVTQAQTSLKQAKNLAKEKSRAERNARIGEFESDPTGAVTDSTPPTVSDEDVAKGEISEGTGQLDEDAITAKGAEVIEEGEATTPEARDAATYDADATAPLVQATLDKLEAATSLPSDEALAKAQTMNPEELAQLGLSVEQIEQAVTVKAPAEREVQEGELIEGSAVDMDRLEEEALNFEAATGTPSTDATVAGQLTKLMSDFEGGETPAWAAGSMRAATAALAARGLAASSMAGQAIIQASMEAALPIAQTDAATFSRFEEANLSNRQQAAILKAEQRALFLGVEFNQEFETRVKNAATISDIANKNFDAEVTIALENARIASTVQIANLDAKNAKILSDAAAMTMIEKTNLSNRQQAAVQQADAFLSMDLKNLDNEQQTAIFKANANVQSILSDTAAENAAKQFNASSENQTNQFYDNLISDVEQFNIEQGNAMEKFTVEQANAIETFNVSQKNARDEFNANQSLVVEQANAQWQQSIVTAENAAAVASAAASAAAANAMTAAAYQGELQKERDEMSFAFQTANNNADRATQIAIQNLANEAATDTASANKSAAMSSAIGAVAGAIISG